MTCCCQTNLILAVVYNPQKYLYLCKHFSNFTNAFEMPPTEIRVEMRKSYFYTTYGNTIMIHAYIVSNFRLSSCISRCIRSRMRSFKSKFLNLKFSHVKTSTTPDQVAVLCYVSSCRLLVNNHDNNSDR